MENSVGTSGWNEKDFQFVLTSEQRATTTSADKRKSVSSSDGTKKTTSFKNWHRPWTGTRHPTESESCIRVKE